MNNKIGVASTGEYGGYRRNVRDLEMTSPKVNLNGDVHTNSNLDYQHPRVRPNFQGVQFNSTERKPDIIHPEQVGLQGPASEASAQDNFFVNQRIRSGSDVVVDPDLINRQIA